MALLTRGNQLAVLNSKLTTKSGTVSTPGGGSVELLSQYEDLLAEYGETTARQFLARRHATNYTSDGAGFISDRFAIPSGTSLTSGTTFRDEFFGWEHTIVNVGSATIIDCELWRVNDAGIAFYWQGSGPGSRSLRFFQHGQKYTVLGQSESSNTRNAMTIAVDGDSSNDNDTSSNRANNAWWLSDTEICYPNSSNSFVVVNILTGATSTLTVSGQSFDYGQSDANGGRMAYDNPVMNPYKEAFNTANPTVAIDQDKVYRLLHISGSGKTRYIVLVYTVSTGQWSYLQGGSTVSESSTTVVHTITLPEGATVDYLALDPTGKRVISNTEGAGFGYHYIDGTRLLVVYENSNHKGIGIIYDGKVWFTEKLTGSAADNTTFGGKSGDMYFLGVDPTNNTRHWIPGVVLPPEDTALWAGGDQGQFNGSPVAFYAGHKDNDTAIDTPPRQIFRKQVVGMYLPLLGLSGGDDSKFGRARVAQLNVFTGNDSKDPGSLSDTCYLDTATSKYVTGVYWHDQSVSNGSGGTSNVIIYTKYPIIPDTDNLVTLKASLTANGLESRQ